MTLSKPCTGITVFYSYTSADKELRDQLANHLSQLKRDELIEEWHDEQILAGTDRTQSIDQAFHSADIILLLISADFLASDSSYHIEMQRALQRHKRGESRVVPVLMRPCDWQHSPFVHLQCLPRNGKPVTSWNNRDEAFALIAKELRKIIAQQQVPIPLLSSTQRQNRERLLKRVRVTWIEGLLLQSLHQAAWIDLRLQEQPDALENPWRLQVQELAQEPHPLPIDTSIVEVYDEADGELLILGEPGSGKTTLLLQLARTLLDRAQSDEHHHMPVIFNLSSWARQRKPLGTWLVEELKTKYQVPHQVGQHWVETNQILPLLDGLDEVTEEARIACAEAITLYHHQHPNRTVTPLVICCRSEEYRALSLPLQRAVSILPLTDEQIKAYLSHAQVQLDGLQQALRDDAELYAQAHRPLMLSIFALAYRGMTSQDLPTELNHEQTLHAAFGTYVTRMLTRRGHFQQWTKQQFLSWLIFIAKYMHQQQQTTFSLENLQSDWLQNAQRPLYRSSFIQLIMLVGLLLIWPPGLPTELSVRQRFHGRRVPSEVINSLWMSILVSGLDILLFGELIGLPVNVLFSMLVASLVALQVLMLVSRIERPKAIRRFLRLLLENRLSIGVSINLLLLFYLVLLCVSGAGPSSLRCGLLIIRSLWRTIWLISEMSGKMIQPVEAIHWSWKNAQRSLKITVRGRKLLLGLVYGCVSIPVLVLVPALAGGPANELADILGLALLGGIFCAFFIWLFFWLLGGLIGGFSPKLSIEQAHLSPNEGIQRSGKNGLIGGLVGGFIGGLLGWLAGGPVGGFIGWSIATMVIGLLTGLRPFIQHFVLRFWLWCTKSLPWNLISFLDEAAERLLLRKVGGSYIFVHRLLLDYLATLDDPITSESMPSEEKNVNDVQ